MGDGKETSIIFVSIKFLVSDNFSTQEQIYRFEGNIWNLLGEFSNSCKNLLL